jgi:cell division protein FtsB
MQSKNVQGGKKPEEGGDETISVPRAERALNWMRRAWRPALSVIFVLLALVILWQGVNGKNGLRVWLEKRAEEKQLSKEIDDLNQENARLRDRVERLKSNPDAIGQVAREQMHYANPNEVIVQLPPEKKPQEKSTQAEK